MKIYWFKAQAPRRVLALVKYLGIDADCIELDLMAGDMKTPAYTALNPNRKAPTMVDGDMVLWESSAIMAYLCIREGSDMWPAQHPAEQVEVLRWLSWNDQHWARAVGPFYFEFVVKTTFHIGEPDRSSLTGKLPELRTLAAVLDGHLAGSDFVACNRLTIADFQLASMACDWRRSEMPLDDYPHILRWLDRLMQIPAWADPWPTKAVGAGQKALAAADAIASAYQ
jgi:glutathione S-transferase